jgi:L-amino acid N-acyltransferase
MAYSIRQATAADMAGLAAVYNDVLTTSTVIFSDKPVTVEDRVAWLEGRSKQGFPVLVADAGGSVAGFASYADFRAWPGYRYSAEHSIHVHRDHRGAGVGRELMQALFAKAREQDMHVMVAGVDASNTGGIAFHERLGFEQAGRAREVGRKFGRWLDLIFLQKFLDAPGAKRDQ